MIAEIKGIVDVFSSAIRGVSTFRKGKAQKGLLTDLVEAHFHFKAIAKNAKTLLDTAGSDPIGKVTNMSGKALEKHVVVCHRLIVDQRMRLFRLNELVQKQAILDVFGSDFRTRIDRIVGTKEEGLLGAGAAIEFYLIFGPMLARASDKEGYEKYGKEMATYRYQALIVSIIGGSKKESGKFSLASARKNLDELEKAAEELRRIIADRFDQGVLVQTMRKAEQRSKFGEKSS